MLRHIALMIACLLWSVAGCYGSTRPNSDADLAGEPDSEAVDGDVTPPPVDFGLETAAGEGQTCLWSGGRARCWGWNLWGQLGQSEPQESWEPLGISGVEDVAGVATFHAHSCAWMTNGRAMCWGANWQGQLGNGSLDEEALGPEEVEGLRQVARVDVGEGHSCALNEESTVWCWGSNTVGQLGIGDRGDARSEPVQVEDLSDAAGISVGSNHSCAWRIDGTGWCWGHGEQGQLGDGREEDSAAPVEVEDLEGIAGMAAGAHHTCAWLEDGSAWCWGNNAQGQLGCGSEDELIPEPRRISDLENVRGVTTGASFSCAWLEGGDAWCWGNNSRGQLGDGTSTQHRAPVEVVVVGEVIGITAGGQHACARDREGARWCWGNNSHGQLGDGTNIDRHIPVQVGLSE